MAQKPIVSPPARRYRDWLESGFPTIREAWLRRARGLGQSIELRQNGTVLTGRFADLDRDGALLLDTVDGRRRITAGDVHFAAACARIGACCLRSMPAAPQSCLPSLT